MLATEGHWGKTRNGPASPLARVPMAKSATRRSRGSTARVRDTPLRAKPRDFCSATRWCQPWIWSPDPHAQAATTAVPRFDLSPRFTLLVLLSFFQSSGQAYVSA
jgi:hypothetical protein